MKLAAHPRLFFLYFTLILLSACSSIRINESLPADQEPPPVQEQFPELQDATDPGNKVAEFAKTLIGVRYRYGGTSPETGLDCSGFIIFVFRETLGMQLPRRVADIVREGEEVSREELQAGDLVFFNTLGYRYSHAGIYLGNNRFIHSPSSGKSVYIADMANKYWVRRFNGARRIIPASINHF